MTRLFFVFALLLAGAAAAAWFADNPGAATIRFAGLEVYTSFAALALAAGAVSALVGVSVWGAGVLRRQLPLVGTERAIKRQRRGLTLLNKALVALSSGDHRLAAKLAGDAELLLPPQPMLHLIAAEAAMRRGDHATARERFTALEASDDGRLIGLRGLISEARRVGQADRALHLARRAFADHKSSPWVLKTLFALEVEAGHWTEAGDALDKVARHKLMDDGQITRHRAALAYSEAAALELSGDRAGALKAFQKAAKLRPDFAPPIAAQARLARRDGKLSRAEKLLLKAWAAAPHPVLAKAYKDLDAAESGADWRKRADRLAGQNPGHVESLLVLADAHLDARDAASAEPLVDRLMQAAPDRRVWALKLRLATLLGQSTDAAEEALDAAKPPPGWVCEDCGHEASLWSPLCSNCQAFDTLEWGGGHSHIRRRDEPAMTMLSDSGLTPLANPVQP